MNYRQEKLRHRDARLKNKTALCERAKAHSLNEDFTYTNTRQFYKINMFESSQQTRSQHQLQPVPQSSSQLAASMQQQQQVSSSQNLGNSHSSSYRCIRKGKAKAHRPPNKQMTVQPVAKEPVCEAAEMNSLRRKSCACACCGQPSQKQKTFQHVQNYLSYNRHVKQIRAQNSLLKISQEQRINLDPSPSQLEQTKSHLSSSKPFKPQNNSLYANFTQQYNQLMNTPTGVIKESRFFRLRQAQQQKDDANAATALS